MRHQVSWWTGLWIMTTLVGCSPDQDEGSWEFAEWEVEELIRIGEWDREGYSLTRISSVAVGPGGQVYVSQPDVAQVWAYDLAGGFLHSIGRRGSGPGEFLMPSSLGFSDGVLWVSDPISQRVTSFDSLGVLLGTIPGQNLEIEPGIFVGGAIPLSDGTFALAGMRRWPAGLRDIEMPILEVDSAGMILDTLITISSSNTGSQQIGTISFSLGIQDAALISVSPDGSGVVAVERTVRESSGELPTFVIERQGVGQSPSFRVSIPYEARPLTQERVAHDVDGVFTASPSFPISRSELRKAYEAFAHLPPVTSLALGVDGSIWIGREDPYPDPLRKWEVFDPDGRPCGALMLPQDQVVKWSDGGLLWVAGRDEYDVPYLVQYRLAGEVDVCNSATRGSNYA